MVRRVAEFLTMMPRVPHVVRTHGVECSPIGIDQPPDVVDSLDLEEPSRLSSDVLVSRDFERDRLRAGHNHHRKNKACHFQGSFRLILLLGL